MPFKKNKKPTIDALDLSWVLQVKNYKLHLDKKHCVGCQICFQACPKQAISIQKQSKQDGIVQRAKIDVDLEKCNFCGICDVTCPYGAITVTQNNNHELSIISKGSYPELLKTITVNTRKCDKICTACKTACPLSLIKISKVGYDGKPVTDLTTLSPLGLKRVQIAVDINKQYCPTCRVCEFKCSPGAMKVTKVFEGKTYIDQTKCPPDCKDCQDVCPITGTIAQDESKKIYINDQTCTFCGACQNVCPQPEALTIRRTKIHHTPIHSGVWNKTLERITSPTDAVKEFKEQAGYTRRELVQHRFEAEERKKTK